MDERKQMVERFWGRVQQVIGLVPMRVIGLLDLFELSASQAIANEDVDWAHCIEEQVKENGTAMYEEAKRRGFTRPKIDVFGLQYNNLGAFRLLPAEKVSINDVRKLIQDNGIRSYITASPERGTRYRGTSAGTANPAAVACASDHLKRPLLEKLAAYYAKRKNLGINRNFFDDLPVLILSESENQSIVRVPCQKCNHQPICTRNGANWTLSNYFQHVRTHLKRVAEVRSSRTSIGSGRIGGPGRSRRRNPGMMRRSVSVEPVIEESGESTPPLSTPVHTDAEDVQHDVSSRELSDFGDGSVEELADSCTEQTDGGHVDVIASCSKKSVSDLIQQFSGAVESTSRDHHGEQVRVLRSNTTSEN